jgi:PAS domain S-box-containing protein
VEHLRRREVEANMRLGAASEREKASEFLQVTLASIGDAVLAVDTGGNVTLLNPVCAALTGWHENEALGRQVRDVFRIINEQTREPGEDIIGRVLRENNSVSLANHTALVARDGREIPIEDSAAPIRDREGKVIGAVLVFHDVTEKRRAQEQLRKSESEYRELVQNANSAIIRWRRDGSITFFNEYAQTFFGYSADEALGRHVGMLVPQKDSSGGDLTGLLQDIVEHPEQYTHNVNENVCRDGRRVWMAWTNKPILDENGQVSRILAVGVDVTERKRIEDTLRFLLECDSKASGEDFFQALTRHLAQSLNMDYVCIDRLEEGLLVAETVAVHFDGAFEDNVSYTLKDTPCGDVVEKAVCCFEKDVRNLFPKDVVLQKIMAESYVGTVLWDSQGRQIGLIAIIGRKPLADPKLATSILQLVAVRAAGELERRQAEDALRESKEDLSRAQAVAQVGSWRLNVERNELLWSDENWRIFGVPLGTPLTYESFLETIHPDDRAYVDEKWTAALRGEPYDIEHRIVVGQDIKWVRERAELEFEPGGNLLGGFGTTQDITDRKRAEHDILASEMRYRRLFESAKDGVLIVDAGTGQIVDVNPFLVELLGFAHEHFLDKKLWEIGLFKDIAASETAFMELQEKGYVRYEDLPLETRDGRRIDVEFVSNVYLVDSTRVVQCNVRDITARKRAEEDMKRLVDNLARSNRDLQQFAYVASHDLQEPLRQVTAFVQLLDIKYKDRLDATGLEYMAFIVEGSMRMHTLIQDLLAYSRVDSTGENMEPVPVRAVLEQALHNLALSIAESRAAITRDAMPTLLGDRAQLVQVFQNLIGNAIKFRGAAPPIIHVGVERQGGEWLFNVRDNGIGFEPGDEEKIFQLFQRLHNREAYAGTGLGLTICKRVIERHGGRIWAKAEPGNGATFYFTLPTGEA